MNFNEKKIFAREISISLSHIVSEPYKINDATDCYNYVKPLFSDSMQVFESVYAMYLDNSSNVIGFLKVSQGGITSSVVDIRLVLATALKCLATSLIICHNHPSGRLEASREDRNITDQLKEAAKIHNIRLLDHVIVTENGFYSFANEGLI